MTSLLEKTRPVLSSLANLESLDIVDAKPDGAVTVVDPAFEVYVDLGKHIDLEAELKRIEKETAGLEKKLAQVTKKLENPKFLAGAKPDVVEAQKAKDKELREMLTKLAILKKDLAD